MFPRPRISSRTGRLGVGLVAFVLANLTLVARAGLEWRVSVKIILDADDRRPCNGDPHDTDCRRHTDDLIYEMFEDVSAHVLSSRGYSVRVTEIVPLWGVSQWFNAPVTGATNHDLRAAAMAAPGTYAYRTNAINVYILNTREPGGGVCSFNSSTDPGQDDIIILGQTGSLSVTMHELGHYFGLCHTPGCGLSEPDASTPFTAGDEVAAHAIRDTLPDNRCWDSPESIALMSFGACQIGQGCLTLTADQCADLGGTYAGPGTVCNPSGSLGVCMTVNCTDNDPPFLYLSTEAACSSFGEFFFGVGSRSDFYTTQLSPGQRQQVDDVFENLMSYHWNSDHQHLTPDQLDRMADISNRVQSRVCSGRTHFVDAAASSAGNGDRHTPFRTVAAGHSAAATSGTSDVLLIRSGSYDEAVTLRGPLEVRATRGPVIIGD